MKKIFKTINKHILMLFIFLLTFDNSFAMKKDDEENNRVTIKTTISSQVTYGDREQESVLRRNSLMSNEDTPNCCFRCLKTLLWDNAYFSCLGILSGVGVAFLSVELSGSLEDAEIWVPFGAFVGGGLGGIIDRSILLQRKFGRTWRIFNDELAEKIIELSERPSGVCLKATAYVASLIPYVATIGLTLTPKEVGAD